MERVLLVAVDPGTDGPGARRQVRSLLLTLDQAETWTSNDGREQRIEEMDPRHRRNVINWLVRNAEGLKAGEEMLMCTGPQPSGDAACDAFDGELSRLMEMDAQDWLDAKPLMRRLRKVQRKQAGL